MAEKIATTSYAYAIVYVRIEAFIRHGIGHFHTHCLLFCFLPLCLRIGVNPLPPPPFFFPHRCSSPKDRRTRVERAFRPRMYTYSRSLCLNSSLGKPDNAGEKCFPCGLMLVDPRCLAAWMGGSHLEERDLEAPFKGIAGRW